jgi:hypothetical protein
VLARWRLIWPAIGVAALTRLVKEGGSALGSRTAVSIRSPSRDSDRARSPDEIAVSVHPEE